jgi:hypothetical protein
MGIKKVFTQGGEPKKIYRGTWVSEDAYAKLTAAKGGCVLLSPFNSFSIDIDEALKFPPNQAARPGFVLVLLVFDCVSRSPIADYSKFSGEKEVLLPPFTIVKVKGESKCGSHGRREILLQDLALAMNEEFRTQETKIRFTVEFGGEEVEFEFELPKGTTIAVALQHVNEEFGRSDISALLKGKTRVSVGASIEPTRYLAKTSSAHQPPAPAPPVEVVQVLQIQGAEDPEAEATRTLKADADRGQADAQCKYGLCLENGTGVAKNQAEAARYLKLSADQGHAYGQYNYGRCLDNGTGVAKNQAEAARYYKLSADQGNANAQCNYGLCLEYGTGVGKNQAEAARCYKLSADQGNAYGQYNYGRCLRNGLGVAKDEPASARYLKFAADHGVA